MIGSERALLERLAAAAHHFVLVSQAADCGRIVDAERANCGRRRGLRVKTQKARHLPDPNPVILAGAFRSAPLRPGGGHGIALDSLVVIAK